MKLKTSITIITGCLVIFLFIMLPVFLSMEKKKDEIETKFQGSEFSFIDVNNENITYPYVPVMADTFVKKAYELIKAGF